MTTPTVAVVGARWPDLSVEIEVLEPLGVQLRQDPGTDPQALHTAIAGADVVLAGPAPRLDEAALAAFGGIGVVRYGVGSDNVDLVAARRRGIWVVIVPDYGTEAVALHAITLTLACLRKLVVADRIVRTDRWGIAPLRPLHLPESLTAGIVGYGRIGRRVAELFTALGFQRVLATSSIELPIDEGTERSSLPDLLQACDVVTLHTPATADGSALLDRSRLEMMRDGSILVNTARGSLVDTIALVEGLATGRPALAGLDVVDPQPPDMAAFAGVEDRVIFTPHMAWYSEESEYVLRRSAAEEARRLLMGEDPLHPVVTPS
jgi:D-3-phosphoglycerate dehydrogenase